MRGAAPSAVVGETDESPLSGVHVNRGLPVSFVLGILTGLLIYATATRPLSDIDVYWHILAGSELRAGTSGWDVGAAWSFAPDPSAWISTQWLSEVLFYELYNAAGWAPFVAFRVLTTAATLAVLALTTLRRGNVLAGVLPYAIAGVGVAALAQDRPQQFTFVGAAVLGGVLVSGLYEGRVPRWWIALPATILWANLHGGWILAPSTLLLVGAGRLLDHGVKDRIAWRQAALGLAMLACGAVSPSGIYNSVAVLRFSSATGAISEWQRTVPIQDIGILTVFMLGLLGLGWARSVRVPRSELFTALVLLTFTWVAWRNVIPGLLTLAPLVARRLDLAFPQPANHAEPRWSRTAGLTMAFLGTLLALASATGRGSYLPTETYPVALTKQIASLPPGQRVLNHYDVAGLTLFHGGPGTKVAIDGRSDRYGAEYIEAYSDLANLKGDWRDLLDRLDPTAALIRQDSALYFYLTEVEGWVRIGSENGYALLVEDAPRG